ncbi:copper amine oxidase N-terminal domain-containing protein [Desulfofundulus thermocisternus]|uniref:copper amine oxidase N-terminal domain-containing protein n=1 Tax=Desulfofundulus thermocisternus TaxID=42471 RepID=UPI00217EF586|nr:copper amine oxidase N-terminal domain-containing protein [Desulfofundulus thermocisternus]MCS5697320.1 copper amine oxidase N-terminal domain-containing protein [Desulfofundulus thermocisternus]
MKKKWIIIVGAVLLVGTFTTIAFADNPIKLFVNGQEIKPDVPPQLINGRTMVPIKWVFSS